MTATIALVDDDKNILTSVSIALQAEGVREDGPLAHGSRGSYRAAALEQLALRLDHLRGLQAARRGTG